MSAEMAMVEARDALRNRLEQLVATGSAAVAEAVLWAAASTAAAVLPAVAPPGGGATRPPHQALLTAAPAALQEGDAATAARDAAAVVGLLREQLAAAQEQHLRELEAVVSERQAAEERHGKDGSCTGVAGRPVRVGEPRCMTR
jgi:hypothetical protein